MTANTKLIHAIADALIGEYEEEATEWLEDGGRANIERIVAEWRAAIEQGRWVERLEDVLVLRALRHEEHWVTVLGGPDIEALIGELVDEDWRARGVETATRIGEVFAHELLRGDTGEPFESIEYDWREHGSAVRGEDDEQPWNAATPLSGTESRLAVCLAEARYVERRVPFVDLPGKVRHAKAAVDAGDESGWTPVADGPVFRYVRALCEDGVERDDSAGPSPSHALHRRARVRPRPLGCARRGGAPRPAGRRCLEGGRERAGEPALARRSRRADLRQAHPLRPRRMVGTFPCRRGTGLTRSVTPVESGLRRAL